MNNNDGGVGVVGVVDEEKKGWAYSKGIMYGCLGGPFVHIWWGFHVMHFVLLFLGLNHISVVDDDGSACYRIYDFELAVLLMVDMLMLFYGAVCLSKQIFLIYLDILFVVNVIMAAFAVPLISCSGNLPVVGLLLINIMALMTLLPTIGLLGYLILSVCDRCDRRNIAIQPTPTPVVLTNVIVINQPQQQQQQQFAL